MGKINNEKLRNIYVEKEGEVYRIEVSNGFRDDGTRDRIIEYSYGNEEQAIKRRNEIKEELKQKRLAGMMVSNDGYTLLEASKIFLSDTKYKKRSGNTITAYRRYLNDFLLPELGDKKLRNITERDLEKLYDKMRNTNSKTTGNPLSGTTIHHTHSTIRAIYNYAIHKKWLLYNPAMHVNNSPKIDSPERDYYNVEEIKKVVECLDKLPTHSNGLSQKKLFSQNLRFKTAITILFNSGLRKEELFGLKWKDIRDNDKIVEIKRAVVRGEKENFENTDIIEEVKNNIYCVNLKTDKSRRNISMPTICFNLLNEYKQDQIKNGKDIKLEDYVFQNLILNGIWNPSDLTKEWGRFLENFELKKITIHDIRHTHATFLLASGTPIQDVSRRLGHSDIATTLKIYVHSNLEQDKKISNQLEFSLFNNIKDNKYALINFRAIASIVTDRNYTSEEEIYKALELLTNEEVNNINFYEMRKICKNYLLDTYAHLGQLDEFLLNGNKESNENYFEFMGTSSTLKTISNFREYSQTVELDNNIMI